MRVQDFLCRSLFSSLEGQMFSMAMVTGEYHEHGGHTNIMVNLYSRYTIILHFTSFSLWFSMSRFRSLNANKLLTYALSLMRI